MKSIKRIPRKSGRPSKLRKVALLLAVIITISLFPTGAATAQVIDRNKPGHSVMPPEDTPEHLRSTKVQATWSPDITVTLDGKKLDLLNAEGAEVAPLILNGTTMIPVRALSYAFGRYINLNQIGGYFSYSGQQTKNVDTINIHTKEKAAMDGKTVDIPQKTTPIQDRTPKKVTVLSDPAAYVIDYDNDYQRVIGLKDVNGNRVYPLLLEGTYYIPIRATAALFGCNVDWDGPNRTVVLTTTPEPPLFGEKEYVSTRYPTKAEKETFDRASGNTERSVQFHEWLNANTSAIVSYTTNFFGGWLDNHNPTSFGNTDFVPYGESYSKAYGVYTDFDPPWYESEPIEKLAKTLVGKTDRETARNIYLTVTDLCSYLRSAGNDRNLAALKNGTQAKSYLQNCSGGTHLMIAMLKAVGIPAVGVEEVRGSGHLYTACYLTDEKAWIYSDWTSIMYINGELQGFDLGFTKREPTLIQISGIDLLHPLELSYYLNYVE
ncbi:MAG: hypothetical protein LBK23_03675 [Oscillospiraceae bacterium]|jgi:hypothetical protein|nr:hypothetical protein [Oscillospiraceae bacterium]